MSDAAKKPLVLAINPETGDVSRVTSAAEGRDLVADGWGLVASIGHGSIERAVDEDVASGGTV